MLPSLRCPGVNLSWTGHGVFLPHHLQIDILGFVGAASEASEGGPKEAQEEAYYIIYRIVSWWTQEQGCS